MSSDSPPGWEGLLEECSSSSQHEKDMIEDSLTVDKVYTYYLSICYTILHRALSIFNIVDVGRSSGRRAFFIDGDIVEWTSPKTRKFLLMASMGGVQHFVLLKVFETMPLEYDSEDQLHPIFAAYLSVCHIHVYNNNSNWFSVPTTVRALEDSPRFFFGMGFSMGESGHFSMTPPWCLPWCWCPGIRLAFRVIVFVQRPCQTDARRDGSTRGTPGIPGTPGVAKWPFQGVEFSLV